MVEVPHLYQVPSTFYLDGNPLATQPFDHGMLHLRRGEGAIWGDGRRYRVTDSWFSFDRHDRFDTGLHVFLEEVTDEEDDLPRRLARDYFVEA